MNEPILVARTALVAFILSLITTGSANAQWSEWGIVDTLDAMWGVVVSPSHGVFICLNRDGYVHRSEDDGMSWTVTRGGEPNSFGPDFYDVSFAGSTVGFACGSSIRWGHIAQVLYWTTDGGRSWEERGVHYRSSMSHLHMVNENFAVVAVDSFLFKSRDRGATWDSTELAFAGSGSIDDIWMIDTSNGILLVNDSMIYRTEDGGDTWVKTYTATGWQTVQLRDIAFADMRHGIVGAIEGIYRTDDGGKTWSRHAVIPGCFGIAMQDSINVVAVYGEETVIRSTDGGRTVTTERVRAEQIPGCYLMDVAYSTTGTAIVLAGGAETHTRILRSALIPSEVAESSSANESGSQSLRINTIGKNVTAEFELTARAEVGASIVDALGREVMRTDLGLLESGSHRQMFSLSSLPSGAYYLAVETPTQVMTGSLRIMR